MALPCVKSNRPFARDILNDDIGSEIRSTHADNSSMQQSSRMMVNSLMNVIARVVTLAARFVIVPFAIGSLGRSAYGVWIVVGQIFAYLRLFEMGMRSSVTRETAVRIARGEHEELNRYVNSAAAYYFGVAGVIVLITTVVAIFYPSWFDVSPEQSAASRVMVMVTGVTLAATVPLFAYGAVAAGLQRYDIVSGTQILADIVRVAVIFALLKSFGVGGGMVLLAIASGGSMLLGAAVRTILTLRHWPQGRFEPWNADRALIPGMISFGVNTVIFVMFTSAAAQVAQILIAALISPAEATDFRNAMELIGGVHAFIMACAVTITPAAGKYFGEQNLPALRRLLVDGTRYGAVLAMTGVVGLFAFSDGFLRLWLGSAYPGEEGTLALQRIAGTTRILAIGHGLFWMLLPAFHVVNGIGRHRFPAAIALVSGMSGVALVLTICLATTPGIEAVAWCVVLPIIPSWALVLPIYCCRVAGQPLREFVWEGLMIPALGCAPAALLSWWLPRLYEPNGWAALLAELAAFGVVLFTGFAWIVLGREERAGLWKMVLDVLPRLRRR